MRQGLIQALLSRKEQTMPDPIIIGHTRAKELKRCPRRYWFGYEEGLSVPSRPADALAIGSLAHKCLEHVYKGLTPEWTDVEHIVHEWFNEAMKIARDSIQEREIFEAAELVLGMVRTYLRRYIAHDAEEYTVLGAEIPFQFETEDIHGNPVLFEGMLDGLFRDKNGEIWIHEIKTMSRLSGDLITALTLDDQIGMYVWAARRALGVQVAGVVYSIMRKAVPAQPERLKRGGLSKAKAQPTTYELYYRAIEEEGLDFGEYDEILEHFKADPNPFVARHIVYRSTFEERQISLQVAALASQVRTLRAMAETYGPESWYRNPTQPWDGACYCDYRSICQNDSEEARSLYESRVDHIPRDIKPNQIGEFKLSVPNGY